MKIVVIGSNGHGPYTRVQDAKAVVVQNADDEDGFELMLKEGEQSGDRVVAVIRGPGRHEFDPVTGLLRLVRTSGRSRITVIAECT